MTKDEALRLALEVLKNNRRTHHYCEDTWYSCPKHEDGCANDSEGDECNCGADEANAEIDQAIIAGEAALEAKDEPVAYIYEFWADRGHKGLSFEKERSADNTPLYTTPPPVAEPHKRTWVGLTDDEIVLIVAECAASHQHTDIHFARAIEAKLKEKNT